MIRDLPRGPYGAFLHTHYFQDRSGVLPRFSMGQGAIFSIQRVKSLEASLVPSGLISETDPLMLEEMAALIAALSLDVVSFKEMRRRLIERDYERRFVCFTFDGAYRTILDRVLPLFEARGMPFTVFVSPDHLEKPAMPWWIALEAVIAGCKSIILEIAGEAVNLRCLSFQEKQAAYGTLFRKLAPLKAAERDELIELAFKISMISKAEAHDAQMLSAGEIRQLAQNALVTIGVRGNDVLPLNEIGFDNARDQLRLAIEAVTQTTGTPACHYAYSPAEPETIPQRILDIVRDADIETASGHIEGALWPEHDHELHALPRIALDNDPATLMRALMLGAEPTPISHSDMEPLRRAS